jgi:hypothetical protein
MRRVSRTPPLGRSAISPGRSASSVRVIIFFFRTTGPLPGMRNEQMRPGNPLDSCVRCKRVRCQLDVYCVNRGGTMTANVRAIFFSKAARPAA